MRDRDRLQSYASARFAPESPSGRGNRRDPIVHWRNHPVLLGQGSHERFPIALDHTSRISVQGNLGLSANAKSKPSLI